MINGILSGITDAIYAEFGDAYEIYTENVEQGLVEPCFLVRCLNPTNERYLGRRRYLTNQFAIQYFPYTDKPRQEINDVIERLTVCLEWISVADGLVAGSNRESNISDNVLTFTVNYNFFAYQKVSSEPNMESVKVKGGIRDGS